MRAHGFPISERETITASHAASELLKLRNPRSAWIMLEGEGLSEFEGIPRDTDEPEYIAVGDFGEGFCPTTLSEATRLVRNGSVLVGMQYEIVDTSGGKLELNVGSWVRLLEVASGSRAIIAGKPSPFAFGLAIERMGIPRQQVVMVGDRMDTDIAGARDAGIRSVLVKTGEYGLEADGHLVAADFELDSIGELSDLL